MLDFTPVRKREQTMTELTAGLTNSDLRQLSNEMIDIMLGMIADTTDADVTLELPDPDANDPAAANASETELPWTLGHVIVHATASSEEGAAIAAELERGVAGRGGRSRSEVPWDTISTVAQCPARLEESRRMRLASLDMWPDQPQLNNTVEPWPGAGPMNAVARFALGLSHDDSHLAQLSRLARDAKAARA